MFEEQKLVPSDDASCWVLTHEDDTIIDDAWEQWQKEQKDFIKKSRKRKNHV